MKPDRIEYSKPIPVRIPPDVLARVDALAKKIGEPRSTVMRLAMKLGLGGLENAFDLDPQKLIALVGPPGDDASKSSNSGKDTARKALDDYARRLPAQKGRDNPPKGKQ